MALSVLLSGDSILQRRLNSRDDAELRPLFDKVRAADVAFTNLEGLANEYRGDPALIHALQQPDLAHAGIEHGHKPFTGARVRRTAAEDGYDWFRLLRPRR